MGAIIVRQQAVEVDFDVENWHRTGLYFSRLGMRSTTSSVGLHWTGGEGGASQVYRVLKDRRLSVQFFIDYDGTIFQMADAQARAAHIGTENARCIGIEIANRASTKPNAKRPRELYTEKVHGKAFRATYFTPAQVASAEKLTRALCKIYGLPYEAPPTHTVAPKAFLDGFRGVIGHFHVTRRKVDPGVRLLQELGLLSKDVG